MSSFFSPEPLGPRSKKASRAQEIAQKAQDYNFGLGMFKASGAVRGSKVVIDRRYSGFPLEPLTGRISDLYYDAAEKLVAFQIKCIAYSFNIKFEEVTFVTVLKK
jgi:hypothetical protein